MARSPETGKLSLAQGFCPWRALLDRLLVTRGLASRLFRQPCARVRGVRPSTGDSRGRPVGHLWGLSGGAWALPRGHCMDLRPLQVPAQQPSVHIFRYSETVPFPWQIHVFTFTRKAALDILM